MPSLKQLETVPIIESPTTWKTTNCIYTGEEAEMSTTAEELSSSQHTYGPYIHTSCVKMNTGIRGDRKDRWSDHWSWTIV